jgi:hypothetical protein
VQITVKANTDEEAIDAAWAVIHSADFNAEEHNLEFEYFDKLTEGNLLHPQHNEAIAERDR